MNEIVVIATCEVLSFEEGGLTLVKSSSKENTVYIDCKEAADGVAEVSIENLLKALKEMLM